MTLSQLNRKMRRAGAEVVVTRQRGSHAWCRVSKAGRSVNVTIPQHAGEIPAGTLASIARMCAPVLGEGWWK